MANVNVEKLAAGLATPAVHVVKQDAPSLSHFGGAPNLPPGTAWPERGGARLAFLARLSLAELQRAAAIDWLPASGALLFFYDLDNQPWGFDPQDRGSWSVLNVADLAAPVGAADSASQDGAIAFRNVGFRRIASLPGDERGAIANAGLDSDENDAYRELRKRVYGGEPAHHVGGFPDALQSDSMELESQLVSNGLFLGDPSGYDDPRVRALQAGAADWRLLLQFDTDDDLGVMWGDCGMLYFWVRADEARKGDFRRTWMILQCG